MAGVPYRFLPWTRRGLARAHQQPDAVNGNLLARPKVTVGLTLQAKENGSDKTAVSGNLDLRLYGPGDVIGIDSRLVVRTDPKPDITNFEPNYVAIVDFDPPDFPWMLTPAQANQNNNLRPWLVLVVVERRLVGLPSLSPGRPLPSVALKAGQLASQLPDLAESWLWAHSQAVSTQTDPALLANELHNSPERNISRLVCPRRLEPRKDYVACVVPAFEVGRQRGLGMPVDPNAMLTPSWNLGQPADIEIPVYYHWNFSTGPVGDIETLARRLKTPDKYKDDKELLAQLNHIGELPVAVDADRLLFEGTNPSRTVFEGALVSLRFDPNPQDQLFQATKQMFATKLEAMLNSGQAQALKGEEKAEKVPTLSPPIYGEHPAKRHVVDKQRLDKHWLEDLSLQPRYRLAAGWGAEVVRTHQQEFMQAAWEQVGEVLAAERAFSLSRLSRDVLKAIEKRHLAVLPESRLLAVLAPMRARLKLAPRESLYGRIANATLPDELLDGAMRRLASARRPTLRMALWRERNLGLESIPKQMARLVGIFANAVKNVEAIDPNRFVPDGILGSRSFDSIPLPDNAATVVDLEPHLGLPVKMSAGEIRQIQRTVGIAREEASRARRTVPRLANVERDGILTETHQLRLLELQRASSERLDGIELQEQVRAASLPGADGVLLSAAEDGGVRAEPLKLDSSNGKLELLEAPRPGCLLAFKPRKAARATVGAVPIRALELYGAGALFNTLPVGSLDRGRGPVSIALERPGRFVSRDGETAATRALTVTLSPAIKDPQIVARYVQAFQEYQQLWLDAQPPVQVAIRPVDFPLNTSVSQTRTRIDPGQTVPARVASMLTLGGEAVAWDKAKGMSNAFISTRLSSAFAERLRYIIPLTFDRVMAYPKLALPISKKLELLAPDVFLPGVGILPEDFIMAVKTNPRFVEAVMLGVNHEMGRDLLWQGFPTDQRGTPFQHFWQRLDGKTDIEPIHQWQARALGSQPGSQEMLVLLIRGQLLERFPNLSIYAYPKAANHTRPGGTKTPQAGEMEPTKIRRPVLRGHLGKDITYVGFDPEIRPAVEEMQKWFFILEEQMTEPRFGFDEPDGEGQEGITWLDVDWSEVKVQPGKHFGLANLIQAPPAKSNTNQTLPIWINPHAARVADALLQRPFRGYYAGIKLVPPAELV